MDCYTLLEDDKAKRKYVYCSVPGTHVLFLSLSSLVGLTRVRMTTAVVDSGYFCNGCQAGHIKGIRCVVPCL
jgi:hypothetical protein